LVASSLEEYLAENDEDKDDDKEKIESIRHWLSNRKTSNNFVTNKLITNKVVTNLLFSFFQYEG
jgi:hypothetical protein